MYHCIHVVAILVIRLAIAIAVSDGTNSLSNDVYEFHGELQLEKESIDFLTKNTANLISITHENGILAYTNANISAYYADKRLGLVSSKEQLPQSWDYRTKGLLTANLNQHIPVYCGR